MGGIFLLRKLQQGSLPFEEIYRAKITDLPEAETPGKKLGVQGLPGRISL